MARVLAAPAKVRVEIDGEVFHVQPLLARDGTEMFTEILNLGAVGAGGDIPLIFSTLVKADPSGKASIGAAVIKALANPALGPLLAKCAAKFALHCDVETLGADGQIRTPKLSDVYDMFFAGHHLLQGKWLLQCLRINFADFIDTLQEDLPILQRIQDHTRKTPTG